MSALDEEITEQLHQHERKHLRRVFAGRALTGLVSKNFVGPTTGDASKDVQNALQITASLAVDYADALLAELDTREGR